MMALRRYFSWLANWRAAIACALLAFAPAAGAQTFQTSAPQAVLMDAETGAIVF